MNEKIQSVVNNIIAAHGEEKALDILIKAGQRADLKEKAGSVDNPFSRFSRNITKQAQLKKSDPVLAEILEEEARQEKGGVLNG